MGIKLQQVNFSYYNTKKNKKYALKDINLNIKSKDEFICIVGHTGSGKSTLTQLLNSLLLPTDGKIDIDFDNESYSIIGENGKNKFSHNGSKYSKHVPLKNLRKHIGLVFQFPEYQIFEETVLKDIMFGPKNFLKDEEQAKVKAIETAKMMGIEDLLEKSPFSLSGGQMRKVAIAGVLASNPDILVLDEPSVGLDPLTKEELFDFLKELNEKEHKSIVIITHDMDIVGKYAKRAIVLNHGDIKFDGSKEDLFKNDNIIETCNLYYPNILLTLKSLKEKLNIDLDIYKYSIEEACKEINVKLGEHRE